MFFRDFKNFNYWGRIPNELEKNGCKIYYGNHQSALSVKDSAKELAERIRTIVTETNCKKVNIIAHSKGGLDVRYAIAKENIGEMVASLTTINTPHKGCEFADYLLTKVPKSIQNKIATTYNTSLRQLGDKNPDFMASVNDLMLMDFVLIWDRFQLLVLSLVVLKLLMRILVKNTLIIFTVKALAQYLTRLQVVNFHLIFLTIWLNILMVKMTVWFL